MKKQLENDILFLVNHDYTPDMAENFLLTFPHGASEFIFKIKKQEQRDRVRNGRRRQQKLFNHE